MGTKIIQDGTLTDIADAIRAKTGKSATMTPLEMPTEIASIETGGGGGGGSGVTEITITNGASNMYDAYYNLLNQVISAVGDVPFIARHISGDIPGYCLLELTYIPYAVTGLSDGKGFFVRGVRPENTGSVGIQFYNIHRAERGDATFTGYSYRLPVGAVYAVQTLTDLYTEFAGD